MDTFQFWGFSGSDSSSFTGVGMGQRRAYPLWRFLSKHSAINFEWKAKYGKYIEGVEVRE